MIARLAPRLPLLALLALVLPAAASAETAQQLFAARPTPTDGPTQSIGQNGKGCIAGAEQLPESGPTWQAMRLSRNHDWGSPATLDFIERLSRTATTIGWKGLYIGDIGQARGGPAAGHASHQTGLDVDIWLLPPASLTLSASQRETISANNVRSTDQRSVNANWTPQHEALLRAAALDPAVNRIFITAPAKLAMCADAPPGDRTWLRKIRPWWGHNDHFHVRLNCPPGAASCLETKPLPPGDGCRDAIWWITDALKPPPPGTPKPKPAPPLQLADLPKQCAAVLTAQ